MKANKSKLAAAAILVAGSLVLGSAPFNSARATDLKKTVSSLVNSQDIHIKYVGERDGFMFLQINVSQQKEQKSLLLINDENGDNLFRETVNAKTYSRMIRVSPEELKSIKVVFATNGNETSKTYAIGASYSKTYEIAEVAE